MGMFDYIEYKDNCLSCGELLQDIQSKSGDCELQTLTPQELFAQGGYGSTFYSYCDCGMYNEFVIKKADPLPPVKVERTS